jgi:hypothetical protein
VEQGKLLSSTSLAQSDAINSSIQTQQQHHDQTIRQLQEANIGIANTRGDFRRDHAELLQYSRQMGTDVTEFRAASLQSHATTRSAIHEHANKMSDQFNEVADRDALLLERVNGAYDNLNGYKAETQQRLDDAQQSLNDMTANLADIRTMAVFSASSIDVMTQVFRKEMCSALGPILEQAFTRSQTHSGVLINRMETLVQTMATDVGCGLHESSSQKTERGSTATNHLDGFDPDAREKSHQDPVVDETQYQYMTSTFSRTWRFEWRVGSLRIEVHTTRRRISGSPIGNSHTNLHVWFRPNQSLIQFPGIAMTYSTGPDQRGFYNIAPAICVIPIVPNDHPIFKAIRRGDYMKVRSLLATGEADIRMQTDYGWTLLHVSVHFPSSSDSNVAQNYQEYTEKICAPRFAVSYSYHILRGS